LDQLSELYVFESRAFDLTEQGPAMGMDKISDSLIFVYSRLSFDVCSIEFGKHLIIVLGIFLLSADSRFCWIIHSIEGPLPKLYRINAR
jgi:hypothetical protein